MSRLTAAYIAIGAHSALRAESNHAVLSELIDNFNGELALIDEITRDADMLDALANDADNRINGVFVYDVAEPYGENVVKALLKGEEPDRHAIASNLLKSILIR